MLKIKDKKDFEDALNMYYNFYVLEDDDKLDEHSKKLKYSLKYVVDYFILHDLIEKIDEREE